MSDHSLLLNKIRRLSIALVISGGVNIGVLALLSYSMALERLPTPYCELKPANGEQQQTPLADYRGSAEIISQLCKLPYQQLVNRLSHTQLIENGYTERDLVLACLVSFYHFDIDRALGSEDPNRQKRIFTWQNKATGENVVLTAFPGLNADQFNAILQFAKTEQWPLTPEGLFIALQRQKEAQNIDSGLVETFMLSPDFWTIELLFNRSTQNIRKQKLLELILEGNWPLFKQFVGQQRQLQDLSEARRQKFLLEYVKAGSESAAELILQTEWDFAVRKMDDAQVVTLLQLLPKRAESEKFAKEMLISPRSLSVWQQASLRLYEYAGEPIPNNWNYKTSLARFAPEKVKEDPINAVEKLIAKPAPPSPVKAPTPVIASKAADIKVTAKPTTPLPKNELKAMATKTSSTLPLKTTLSKAKPKSSEYRLYIVQEGDSLWKISRRFGVDMEILKQRNQIQSNAIKPGTVLRIP